MIDLIPTIYSTSSSTDGLFVGGHEGINFLTGPPISVSRFGLENDNPCWRSVDPRYVQLDLQKVRIKLAEIRYSCRSEDKEQRGKRRREHFRHLRTIVGHDLFRLARRLPSTAQPFRLIWLAHRSPGFNELLMDAPMIAVAVAHTPPSQEMALSLDDWRIAVDEESQTSRRDILTRRGFPESAVGGVQRVTAQAADPRFLAPLAATLQDKSVLKLFNHTPVIGPDLLRIFSDEQLLSRVSGRFIRLVAKSDKRQRYPHVASMIGASLTAIDFVESRGGKKVTFSSPEKLKKWHNDIACHVAYEDIDKVRYYHFRAPPFKGIPGYIEQIQTGEDLIAQAILMQQCCASPDYVIAMRNGHTFLFRANGFGLPSCTIEVTAIEEGDNDKTRRYAVTQVAGKGNKALPARALAAIRIWAEGEGIEMLVGQDRGPMAHVGRLIADR